jgi:hypothetical protein
LAVVVQSVLLPAERNLLAQVQCQLRGLALAQAQAQALVLVQV